MTKSKPNSDASHDALVSMVNETDLAKIRDLRRLEAELEAAREQLRLEQQKRQQAEEELVEATRREGIWLATSEQIAEHVVPKRPTKQNKPSATPVICCTDWHAEAKVDPALVNQLNEFNLDICKQRIAKLWEKSVYLIEFWRGVSEVRDAVLWLGGDLISGSIHVELEESNFLGPTEAVLFVVQQAIDGINYLLEHAKIDALHVVCNFGNHGRTTDKKRISTGYLHSYEWLAYNQLAAYFKATKNVTFQIANGYHAICEIQGWRIRFHHGDAVRYYGGVGGISIPVVKAVAQWNKSSHVDYDVFGHYHQFVDYYSWVSCGSLIGYDAYALSVKADYQVPSQTLLIIDREYGKVAALPIFVDKASKQAQT